MTESNRSLSEFVTFLSTPDMYGSMSLAATMTKWLIHAVVTLLMLAAVVGVLFIVLKFAADILFLSGLGHMMGNGGNGKAAAFRENVKKFASKSALDGNITDYLKSDLWKPILTLAFIGLLASGTALPLAGALAGSIGAMVDKLLDLDPEGQIRDFDTKKFKASLNYTRSNDLKMQYDKAVAEARQYRETIYDIGTKNAGSDSQQLKRAQTMYTHAMMRANLIGKSVKSSMTKELKVPKNYFKQHTKDGMCVGKFKDSAVVSAFGGSFPCK